MRNMPPSVLKKGDGSFFKTVTNRYSVRRILTSKDFEEEKEKAELAARNTLKKDKRINLRLTQKDYHQIQAKAIEEGIPYQTLISSIIHKYLNGSLTPKSSEQNKGVD